MIRTLERSPIRELLDMIEARAPFFMRCGGLVQLYERGATYEQRQEIERLYRRGHPRKIIARRMGVCVRTVYNHTKHLRTMKTQRKKQPPLTAEARRMNAICRHFNTLSLAGKGWVVGRLTSDYKRAVTTAHGND